MTDSATSSKPDKRERLVESARVVLHRQGVQKTTIADVATVADVPVGNVYYYFKTKDDLVEAAIEAHAREIQAALASFERHRTPQARLKAFVRSWVDQADVAARYGCPHGCLSQELDKRDDGLDQKAAELLALFVDWTEQQLRLMGKRDARDLAMTLVATFQGASLLTNSFRDPQILVRQSRRLERWIDSLS